MSKNYLDILTDVLFSAPLWVQEVIFLDMKKHLETKFSGITSPIKEDEVYPAYTPVLTFKGKRELETHDHNLDINIYKCLKCANEGQRVIDITLNNFWTLEETSICLADCIKQEFVQAPENSILAAGIFYLGNQIRLGEYVKRLDKINVQDLDNVLRKQKVHNEENPDSKIKIGEVLIDMGYVANNDINKIIYIKDEAKKRFIVSNDMRSPAKSESVNYQDLQQKIQKLTQENNLLKDKLRAIFNLQNKNKPN